MFFSGFVGQLWEIQALLFLRVNDKGGIFYVTHFLFIPLISQTASMLRLDASMRCALIKSGDFHGDVSHLSEADSGGLEEWTLELRNFLHRSHLCPN